MRGAAQGLGHAKSRNTQIGKHTRIQPQKETEGLLRRTAFRFLFV